MMSFTLKQVSHLFYLFLIISSNACSNEVQEDMDSTTLQRKKISLIKSNEVIIPISKKSNFDPSHYQYLEEDGSEYLLVYNKRISAIEIFNLSSNEQEASIQIPLEGSESPKQMESFFATSLDSIYALSPKTWSIALYNRSGNKMYGHKFINNLEKPIDYSYTSNIYVIFNNWAYVKDNKVFFPCIEQAPLSDIKRYDKSWLSQSYDLKTRESSFMYNYPDSYKEKNFSHLTVNQFRTLNSNGEFVYSFSADPNIYVTNYDDISKSYFGGSKLFDPPIELPDTERDWSSSKFQTYRMLSPFYRGILYDKYRKVYYRFAVGKGNPKAPLHQTRYHADISVIMLDEKFNLVGETLLPKNTYSYKFWFVGKEGLYIGKTHPFNEDISEDNLNFDIFTLGVSDQL